MKKTMRLCALALAIAAPQECFGQVPCHHAHGQVEAYFFRVKAFADNEAYRNIPLRCGPNMRCGNWWIGRLNVWYGRQIQQVHIWHMQIQRDCQRSRPIPAPQTFPSAEPERLVMIEIPSTPKGYRP